MKQMWNNLPIWSKFIFTAILSVILTIGITKPEIFDLFSFVSKPYFEKSGSVIEKSETIKVEFNIYSKDTNEPLDRAEVKFIFEGAPVARFTNYDGYVRIDIPNRDDVDVVIKKEGFHDLNRTINLKADPNRTITYFLERDEGYNSYNLHIDGFSKGMKINSVLSLVSKFEFSMTHDFSFKGKPPFKVDVDFFINHIMNRKSDYEIVDSITGNPFEILEKVGTHTDTVSVDMNVNINHSDKTYTYSDVLSENGNFASSSILYEYSDGKWSRKIIGKKPTNKQILELSEPWSLDDIFLRYPKKTIEIGYSWNLGVPFFSQSLEGVSDTSIQATFKEISEYEGESVAVISIEGSTSFLNSFNSYKEDKSDNYSLFDRILESVLMQWSSDLQWRSDLRRQASDYKIENKTELNTDNDNTAFKKLKTFKMKGDVYGSVYKSLAIPVSLYSEVKILGDIYFDNLSVGQFVIEIFCKNSSPK